MTCSCDEESGALCGYHAQKVRVALDAAVAQRVHEISITPIPMRIHCPECGELHLDDEEFATKAHHTHACQHCGAVFRNAIGPTVGVRFLPGFKNG